MRPASATAVCTTCRCSPSCLAVGSASGRTMRRRSDQALATHCYPVHPRVSRLRVLLSAMAGIALLSALLGSCVRNQPYRTVTIGDEYFIRDVRLLEGVRLDPPPELSESGWTFITDVAVLSDGQVLVSDDELFGVGVFHPDYVWSITPGYGLGPGELTHIARIIPSGEDIILVDADARRYVVYDVAGNHLRSGEFPRRTLGVVDHVRIAEVRGSDFLGVELRDAERPDQLLHVVDMPTEIRNTLGISAATPRHHLRHVADNNDTHIVVAWETYDLVVVVDTDRFTEVWYLIDDRRGRVQHLRNRYIDTGERVGLITDVAIDSDGIIYVGRGIGWLPDDEDFGPMVGQIDAYDTAMSFLDSWAVSGRPDLIDVRGGRLVAASYRTSDVSLYRVPDRSE